MSIRTMALRAKYLLRACRTEIAGVFSIITGICAIATVIIAILGFRNTIEQLEATEAALRASNTYQVQRDARLEIDRVLRTSRLLDAIQGKEISQADEIGTIQALWAMQNFYLSVYRQSLVRGLSDEFVSAFVIDFCDFQKQSFVSGAWEKMMAEGKLSSSHQEMRAEWCGF